MSAKPPAPKPATGPIPGPPKDKEAPPEEGEAEEEAEEEEIEAEATEEEKEPEEKPKKGGKKQIKVVPDSALEEKHITLLKAQLPSEVVKKLNLKDKTNKQQIAALETAVDIYATIKPPGKGTDPGSKPTYPKIPQGAEGAHDDLEGFAEPEDYNAKSLSVENTIKPLHVEGVWKEQGDEIDLGEYDRLLKLGPTKFNASKKKQ